LTDYVTDPRGTATTGTGFTDDYEQKLQFNYAGLPVVIAGPQIIPSQGAQGIWPTTNLAWTKHLEIRCSRSPAAVAINGDGCMLKANGDLKDPSFDAFSKIYTYHAKPPFTLSSVTDPAPTVDSSGNATGPVKVTSYT